jgi:hypothetical protein
LKQAGRRYASRIVTIVTTATIATAEQPAVRHGKVTRGYKKQADAQLTGAANSDIFDLKIRKDVSYRNNTDQ